MASTPSLTSSSLSETVSSHEIGDRHSMEKEIFDEQSAEEDSLSRASDSLRSRSISTNSRRYSKDHSSRSSFSGESQISEDDSESKVDYADSSTNEVWHDVDEESSQEEHIRNRNSREQAISRNSQSTNTSNGRDSFYQNESRNFTRNRSANRSRASSSASGIISRQSTNNASDHVSNHSKNRQSNSAANKSLQEQYEIDESQPGNSLPHHTKSTASSRSSQATSTNRNKSSNITTELSSRRERSNMEDSQISMDSRSTSEDSTEDEHSTDNEDGERLPHHATVAAKSNASTSRGSRPRSKSGSRSVNGSIASSSSLNQGANSEIDEDSIVSRDELSWVPGDQENEPGARLPHHASSRRVNEDVDADGSDDDSRTSFSSNDEHSRDRSRDVEQSEGNASDDNSRSTRGAASGSKSGDSSFNERSSRKRLSNDHLSGKSRDSEGNLSGDNLRSTESSASKSRLSGIRSQTTSNSPFSSHERRSNQTSHDEEGSVGNRSQNTSSSRGRLSKNSASVESSVSKNSRGLEQSSKESQSIERSTSGMGLNAHRSQTISKSSSSHERKSKQPLHDGSRHEDLAQDRNVISPAVVSEQKERPDQEERQVHTDESKNLPTEKEPPLQPNIPNTNAAIGKPPLNQSNPNLQTVPPVGGGGNPSEQKVSEVIKEGFELLCGSIANMSDLGDSLRPDRKKIGGANIQPRNGHVANTTPDKAMTRQPVAQPRDVQPVPPIGGVGNVNLVPPDSAMPNREGTEFWCGSIANMSDLGDSVLPDGTRINDLFDKDGKLVKMHSTNGSHANARSETIGRQPIVEECSDSESQSVNYEVQVNSKVNAIPENDVESSRSERDDEHSSVTSLDMDLKRFDDLKKDLQTDDNEISIDSRKGRNPLKDLEAKRNQLRDIEATSESDSDSSIDEEEGIQVPLLYGEDEDSMYQSERQSKTTSREPKLPFKFKELDPTKDENKLSESVLSFLISSPMRRLPYFSALFIIFVKLAILAMLIINLTGKKLFVSEQNPLGVPISTSWPVATCQILALIISVLTQDDLLNGLTIWREGNFKNSKLLFAENNLKKDNNEPFGGVSKSKWLIAILLQIFVGLSTLFATFLLIITSSDVVSILLTFAIVTFVSKLDNDLFVLGKRGILGENMRQEVQVVMCTIYELRQEEKKMSCIRSGILTVVVLLSLFAMVVGWGYTLVQQINGAYWPPALLLQLDDTHNSTLGYLSGIYTLQSHSLGYTNGAANLMHCASKSSWTIFVEGEDPCQNSIAISAPRQSGSADITTAAQLEWFVTPQHDSNLPMLPIENIFLGKVCSSDDDCGGAVRGECKNNICNCRSDFYGITCRFEFKRTCPFLGVDEQTSTFRSPRALSLDYELLRKRDGSILQLNQHPVFISKSSRKDLDVMLYSGLRWVIISADSLMGKLNVSTNALVSFFEESNFDAMKQLKVVDQISAPVRFNSALDQPAPLNLIWSADSFSTSLFPSETRLICKACDKNENLCLNGGTCLSDGTCECKNRAKGDLCQIAPLGDGYCDHPFFNTPFYGFDGGDCCATTCSSSSVDTCGFVSLPNRAETSYVGFPFCRNPNAQGCDTSEVCWSSSGQGIQFLVGGSNSILSLSGNGNTMIVSEPSINTVRIFDQVANKWLLRGQGLQSDAKNDFGTSIAISVPPKNLALQRAGRVPLTLAVAMEEKNNFPSVRLYQWRALDIEWSHVCDDIVIECYGNGCVIQEMSLGRDGGQGILAVSLRNEKVYVYEITFDSNRCDLKWTTNGTKLNVSGNGKRLAVANPRSSSGLFLSDIAIFDISARGDSNSQSSQGTFPILDLDYRSDNLLSIGLISKYVAANILILSFALDYEGRIMSVALINSDSSMSIEALRQKNQNSLYQSADMTKIKLTESNMSAMQVHNLISAIHFSSDGTSLGVKYGNSIHVASYSENSNPLWTITSIPLQTSDLTADFSVSSRDTIASAEGSLIETVSLSRHCSEGESLVLISLKLDGAPEDISWYLEHVGIEEGLLFSKRTLVGCKECYTKDFAGTDVLEEVCVPNEIISCLRFNFHSKKQRSGDVLAVFVDDINLVQYNGGIGEFDYLVSSNEFDFKKECSAQLLDDNGALPACSNEDTLLVTLVTSDLDPEETEWKVETLDSGKEVLRGGPYDESLKTFVAADCISVDSECYVFVISDTTNGNGICCESGYGNVELFLKSANDQVYRKIYNPRGRFSTGRRQEVRFGGGCPPTNDPSIAPVPYVIFPTTMGPTSIEPTIPSRTPSPTQAPLVTLIPTANPTSTPLVMTAVPQNPTTAPTLFSESQTPTEARLKIQIVITITLDDQPEETGWFLSDNTGSQTRLAEVTAGSYNIPRDKPREFVQIETDKSYLFCITDAGEDGIENGKITVSFKGFPILLDNGIFKEEKCHVIKMSSSDVKRVYGTE